MNEYEICMGKERVGQARVRQEGLYYCFQCRCELESGMICRVVVSCGGHHENLGILVPEGRWYQLTKRMPIKCIGNGRLEFQVVPRCSKRQETFLCVYPEEPFRYIRKLQEAYLERRDGQLGIVLQGLESSQPSCSSTGQ